MATYKENIQNLKDKIFEFYKSSGENEQLNKLITDSDLDNETIQTLLRFHSTYTTELHSMKQFNQRSFNLILDEFYRLEIERLSSVKELEKDVAELKHIAKNRWFNYTIQALFVIIVLFSLASLDTGAARFAVDSLQKIFNVTNPINKGE